MNALNKGDMKWRWYTGRYMSILVHVPQWYVNWICQNLYALKWNCTDLESIPEKMRTCSKNSHNARSEAQSSGYLWFMMCVNTSIDWSMVIWCLLANPFVIAICSVIQLLYSTYNNLSSVSYLSLSVNILVFEWMCFF